MRLGGIPIALTCMCYSKYQKANQEKLHDAASLALERAKVRFLV
jgi:hypothetical protein